ncbi:MAG: sensor histidine kinase [Anaerolineales bacterium]|nr:sensor histidine kinase [Anaerolineales bacterium]
MNSTSPALIFENDPSLPGRPHLRGLVYFWKVVYLASLIVTLGAVLWNTPPPWGWREAVLIGLVSFQVALYLLFFVVTYYARRSLTQPWLTAYFLLNLGLWLIEWHLEVGFWWIIWVQVLQLYISLPLKLAIPATGLIFLVVAHFESGLDQFFGSPVGEVIERFIPWLIVSISFSFVSTLIRANQERARLITELQAAKQELELAHRQEVELVALRERERLAREMHDSLGHALVTLSVQLEAVQRLYPVNPEDASRQINELKTLTRTSMDSLRHTLTGLRAPGLDYRPLAQSLADLSAETSQRTGLEVKCRIDPEVDRLNPAMTEALWRVIQEALMNVEKHAAARTVQIDLSVKPEAIALRVADDGTGLPPNYTNRPGHYGLQGMRERIEGLGGVLTLRSNGQAGTLIEAHLPLIGTNGRHEAEE